MATVEVDIASLSPPVTRPYADPIKLQRIGPFDWNEYEPIEVERSAGRLIIQDGMTRVEAARRAGISKLPAYVYDEK
jgi:hypothetical protein